ncbi:MAG: Single-stranded-DNA-specific exonuclease RecJ [Microgenomates group bacterium GW2011_GWC1_43_11]|uniref:Single-stranded-DNA-specific exonuclease RecJ n=2 Tax=Candidatus Gottesmaniibacteriota TaxID=1752720 RepID=A0A0G1IN45_9BACT|nr:MAG: Single-stranded-DNA-specific exonuclease RecJ [Microgenomates group bacterium GW2011_GWC1_43_11]KKT38716.1 MAG: Single-stranded-DNA-specific exonuclease RecJ [Candidatus Gottesmanbacteria bacterium GW2011_GWB1_44_11c]KKT60570.1 MAG: Single-stranded-DNA-specific exonuclease RecJ [Candidatus Gottesmanbacteria bacterium GW2011_GWA1_44_24b]HCM82600.1 single-stranded-DNA-specific exonuclease RecJ [Patescibacteria group bacterium]
MKKWNDEDILITILRNRGISSKKDIEAFLHPKHPDQLSLADVSLDEKSMKKAITRILKAIKTKESIVVYTDYDADGLTGGAIVWETVYKLGGRIMPYVPHRVEEGYGLTEKGIDAVLKNFHPTLLITVDHGITAFKEIEYAESKGMDVIVTDHHMKPKKLPDALIIHTTKLSGAGVAFFLAKELITRVIAIRQPAEKQSLQLNNVPMQQFLYELLPLAAIGTIADMMPLLGTNRSIAKYGLEELRKTNRVGLLSLMEEAGVRKDQLTAYSISHMLAPRLNAMGRMEHALDGLRLLCTNSREKAVQLASKLGLTNRERQQLTLDTTIHAKEYVQREYGETIKKKLLFVAHQSYSQGIIGLVAGKLVETYYLPSIVVSIGEDISKASARSIKGFDVVEAIRSFSHLLVDVGGHPLAAGFTVKTEKLQELQEQLEKLAQKEITDAMLKRPVPIDLELPLGEVTEELYEQLQQLQPFGFGNPDPVFLSKGVKVMDFRKIGLDGKHLKFRISSNNRATRFDSKFSARRVKQCNNATFDAVFFNHASFSDDLKPDQPVDIAYTIDLNEWNGNRQLQLKVKDIQ